MASFAVGKLPGDEEAALATDVHACEAGVPAGYDAVEARGEGKRRPRMIIRGVEFGAVGEPAGVFDGVLHDLRVGGRGAEDGGYGEGAGADLDVYVLEGIEGFGKADDLGNVGCGGGGCGLCGCGGVVDGGFRCGRGLGGCDGGHGGQEG